MNTAQRLQRLACGGGIKKYWDGGDVPLTDDPMSDYGYDTTGTEDLSIASAEDPGIDWDKRLGVTRKNKKKPYDWKALLAPMALSAVAGGLGGNTGVAMSPIIQLLMTLSQGGKGGLAGLFGQATSGKTPAYNPNNPYGDGRGGGG